MSDFSPNLSLPLLLASEKLKHITLNESLIIIDNLLMAKALSRNINQAPNEPIDGDCYIIPSNSSGLWANKTNQIAIYNNQDWDYIIPKIGFHIFIIEENKYLHFNGNIWIDFPISFDAFQNLSGIGIGTNFDSTNPICAKLNNVLFSAKYQNDNGDGNIRIKLNKEQTNKTSSFLFQNNWSGRAEFGLCGDDNFSIKISQDGDNWVNPIMIENSTGQVIFRKSIKYEIENNILIHNNNSPFLHLTKPNIATGDNLFLGYNSGNISAIANNPWESSSNLAIGKNCLAISTIAYANVAIGNDAMQSTSSAADNVAIGVQALSSCNTGVGNTAIGRGASPSNSGGCFNSNLGHYSLQNNQTGWFNTALGKDALSLKIDGSNFTDLNNCTGIGYNARVSASNQVQLGSSGTTTYAYGAIQDRSDIRDKAEIRDTILGLDFINALRPVDFKWDMRDDYFETTSTIGENGSLIEQKKPIPKDGSKKRNRYHHGLIAQEVAQVIEDLEIDFGGYQNHSLKGGCDVRSIGYTELIAPLIRAVQELNQKISNLETQNI